MKAEGFVAAQLGAVAEAAMCHVCVAQPLNLANAEAKVNANWLAGSRSG